jgi:hypothetical protein
LSTRDQGGDRHAVDRQGARLVGAEDGHGTQRLDGSRAPCEYLALGHAPSAEHQEDRQDDRKFLRQRGHGQGNAGQGALHPFSQQQAVADGEDNGRADAEDGKDFDQSPCLDLERRWRAFNGNERRSDLADFGSGTRGKHPG